jgi:hypothetical protein
MATNLYGTSCTPNTGGVQDFYTKAEINQLLNAKAGTATTYTRLYIDGQLTSIGNTLSGLTAGKVDTAQLNLALAGLQSTIESDVADTYATLADTYTKLEVDGLFAAIDLNPADYIRTVPATSAENTINPGTNNAVALTVRGSSVNPIVTQWLDSTNDRIGYIRNDGLTVFEGRLDVGRLVSDSQAAINAQGKRVTGVAPPIFPSDAVPFEYLKTYTLEFYENIINPEPDTVYTLDAGQY